MSDQMPFEMLDINSDAVIKVIGVGGGGGNAVKHMLEANIEGVDFICANTDAQALRAINAQNLQIGQNITKGLGAGANPDVGRQAALEDRELIQEAISGADMLFITAGMGGGTGTGAAPVIAQIARDMGILSVAVVTKPFSFEGKRRNNFADEGLRQLGEHVDSLITIPNAKLLETLGANATVLEAFASANNVLCSAVQGISELITVPGMINVDFADVRTVMSEMGMAMMGAGAGTGENRAAEATEMAISSPLLEDINLKGARGILVNVISGYDLTMGELHTIGEMVEDIASDEAQVIIGSGFNAEMNDEIRITIVATGLDKEGRVQQEEEGRRQINVVPRDTQGNVDYNALERPTAIRQQGRVAGSDVVESTTLDDEYLDVPAFLRRQAD
ncbi:MAG: cell division protein FtsZ [Pseudomonadota bacterium]